MNDKYERMRELVRARHRAQSRNGGKVPYAQHCERVAQLLAFVLDTTKEAQALDRENMVLASMGHDLIEDTEIGK